METKFDTKSTITQLVYEISRRSLHPTRGFPSQAILPRPNPLPWQRNLRQNRL